MKKNLFFMLLAACCMSFASCSSDDDNNDDNKLNEKEAAMAAIAEKLGDPDIEFYSPEPAYQMPFFSFLGQMSRIFGRESSESDLIQSFMERTREGELMYYAK